MIAISVTMAGCADNKRPEPLHGHWQRTVVYPALTLHTELYLAPDGAMTHTVTAHTVTGSDTLTYTATARGSWFLQRTVSEFRLLQALYDPATLRRNVSTSGADTITVTQANAIVLKALPPTWDSFDAYLLEPSDTARIPYPISLLELTDTTAALTGLGAYSSTVRLSRHNRFNQ